jgi:hypothetical protein
MKKLILIFSIFFFFIAFQKIARAQYYCDFIKKVQKYQASVKLIYQGQYDIIDLATFDLDTYLEFFNKLVIPDGMKIKVYYFDNNFNGSPFLYSIRSTQNIDEIIDSIYTYKIKINPTQEINKRFLYYDFLNDSCSKAKNNVIPENSDFGFFQYLFFSEMGEQFALKWHTRIESKKIICSNEMINRFIKEHKNNTRFYVDSISLEKLRQCSPTPIVKSSETYYEITWIENRTHSGVFKCTYRIEKESPFRIKKIKEKKILDIIRNFVY